LAVLKELKIDRQTMKKMAEIKADGILPIFTRQ
jgi:hypothetical protein